MDKKEVLEWIGLDVLTGGRLFSAILLVLLYLGVLGASFGSFFGAFFGMAVWVFRYVAGL